MPIHEDKIASEIIDNILTDNKELWKDLSQTLGCGGCPTLIKVDTEYTCNVCGRMICENCKNLCKFHRK